MAKKAKFKKVPQKNKPSKLGGTMTPAEKKAADLRFLAALMELHKAQNGGSLEGFKLGGKVYHEGTPGVPNPEIAPFMTSDDMMEDLNFDAQRDEAFRNADAALAAAKTDRDYNLRQVHEQFLKSTSAATDDMIGRGLFQSSVKDAALYDLEAQRALQDTYLNAAFKNQEIAAQSVKDSYLGQGGYQERFDAAMGQKMVQNAQAAGQGMEPWKVAPTAGGFQPVAGPAAPTSKGPAPKPPKGVGHAIGQAYRQQHGRFRNSGIGMRQSGGMTIRKVPSRNPKDRLAAGRGR